MLCGELEHLKIETRLIVESFQSDVWREVVLLIVVFVTEVVVSRHEDDDLLFIMKR